MRRRKQIGSIDLYTKTARSTTLTKIDQRKLSTQPSGLFVTQQHLADGMRPGRRVIGLGGMGGALVVAGIDEGQELLGVDRLELLEAGDLHLALAILQHLEALPLVEQILNPAAVDFEECDVHGRIVEAAG